MRYIIFVQFEFFRVYVTCNSFRSLNLRASVLTLRQPVGIGSCKYLNAVIAD